MLEVFDVGASAAARDRFVVAHRPPRQQHDPWRAQGVFVEDERAADGAIARVITVLLTGRECPWRCVMCDLWKGTLDHDTPAGALPSQLDAALASVGRDRGRVEHVKLYNAGSFFDPRAVPVTDYLAIAERVASFNQVIVESHPALIGPRVTSFQAALIRAAAGAEAPDLQVAMGLETAAPAALERLNKGFSIDGFRRAAGELLRLGASLRVFLLVGVPFIEPPRQLAWLLDSVSFAFDCGASVVSLIPTRGGNGTLEVLAGAGAFQSPSLRTLEAALEEALSRSRGRVFADLWDLRSLATCELCFEDRRTRLHRMNVEQRPSPGIPCAGCGGSQGAA